jgi:hypothetical protein
LEVIFKKIAIHGNQRKGRGVKIAPLLYQAT